MTVYGRREAWEDSPEGWPQRFFNTTSAQLRTDGGGVVNRPDGRGAGAPGAGTKLPPYAGRSASVAARNR